MKRRDALRTLAAAGASTLLGGESLKPGEGLKIKPPEILTNYYTWYDLPWVQNANTEPLRGRYNSTDLTVIEAQNKEKNAFGLTTDCVSWWGPDAPSYLNFKQGYLRAANFTTRKYCFAYQITARLKQSWAVAPVPGESLGGLDPSGRTVEGHWKTKYCYDFNDPYNRETFLSDIDFLEACHFSDANYHRIDGRPVIYIWLDSLKNFGMTSFKARKKVFLIGCEPVLFPPSPSETERLARVSSYDAISCYGINPVVVAKTFHSLNEEFLAEYTRCVRAYVEVLKQHAPNTRLLLPVQFTYHDNRGDHDPKDGKCRILTSRPAEGAAFLERVRSLYQEVPRIMGILVTSYNEHYEGTATEPSTFKGEGGAMIGYGGYWLILIKRYFKSLA